MERIIEEGSHVGPTACLTNPNLRIFQPANLPMPPHVPFMLPFALVVIMSHP